MAMGQGGFSGPTGGGGSGPSESVIIDVGNGGEYERTSTSEEIIIAAAASSLSIANLLPADALIICLLFRVTVAIPTAATFSIGIPGEPALFASGLAVAAGTKGNSYDFVIPVSPFVNADAEQILITPGATPGAATGRVRVGVVYESVTNFTG